MIEPSSHERHDLRAVLRNTGFAMREIGQTLTALETTMIGEHIETQNSSSRLMALQTFDLLIQSVEELALLFDRMETHEHVMGEVDYIDVIAPIKLQSIRDHIAGQRKIYSKANGKVCDSDVSLF